MGKLTTQILDTAHGRPGAGIVIELHRLDGERRVPLGRFVSNNDGRCDSPLLEGTAFQAGTYELSFAVGNYFAAGGIDLPQPRFLDEVVLRFGIADASAHYHVPLLVSPFGYSTYRGS